MRTALDSSVLLAIFNGEDGAEQWLEALIRARREGRLILCEVVYAEIAPAFPDREALEERLRLMGATVEPINNDAAWVAGESFRQYRESGGPREHLIPDFLIAAHALSQADRLAALDRGYLRRWFGDLKLLKIDGGYQHSEISTQRS
jgi:predicted nucleic acid-binding protein